MADENLNDELAEVNRRLETNDLADDERQKLQERRDEIERQLADQTK